MGTCFTPFRVAQTPMGVLLSSLPSAKLAKMYPDIAKSPPNSCHEVSLQTDETHILSVDKKSRNNNSSCSLRDCSQAVYYNNVLNQTKVFPSFFFFFCQTLFFSQKRTLVVVFIILRKLTSTPRRQRGILVHPNDRSQERSNEEKNTTIGGGQKDRFSRPFFLTPNLVTPKPFGGKDSGSTKPRTLVSMK